MFSLIKILNKLEILSSPACFIFFEDEQYIFLINLMSFNWMEHMLRELKGKGVTSSRAFLHFEKSCLNSDQTK